MTGTVKAGLELKTTGFKEGAADAAKVKAELAGTAEAARKMAQDATGALNATGNSARQTAAALRGVPAQFTDIVTQLAAGQNPMQVLIQQGGQLKDMFGGIGPAVKALGGYIVGMINPLTLSVAAVGTLAAAFARGRAEAEAMRRAVVLSGGASGASLSALQGAAINVAGNAGASRGEATEVLAKLAEGGQVAAQNMARAAEMAIRLARVGGPAIAETAAAFEALGKKPLEASVKLNEQFNHLTIATWERIRALEKQGRLDEAAALAQKTYADAMDQRARLLEQSLGFVETAWNAVRSSAKLAWDAMLNVGRDDTPAQKVVELLAKLRKEEAIQADKASDPAQAGLAKGMQASIDRTRAALRAAEDVLAAENRKADADRRSTIALREKIATQKDADKAAADHANALKRMLDLARKNELDAYYATGGEEIMRLEAEKRAAADIVAAHNAVARAAQERAAAEEKLIAMTTQGKLATLAQQQDLAASLLAQGKIGFEGYDEILDQLGGIKAAGKETADELVRAIDGFGKQAAATFVDTRANASDLFRSILREATQMVAYQNIFKPLFGQIGQFAKGFFPTNHSGGIAGAEATAMRAVSPMAFFNAPRLHGGGIAGDEVPTILKRGEGVFTEKQMARLAPVGAGVQVSFNLINRTGVQQTARQQGPARQSGDRYIVDVVLDAMENDPRLRAAMG